MTDNTRKNIVVKMQWSVIVLLATITVTYHLVSASIGFPLYRDQHICTAIDYARNGVDWLNPIIKGFNANGVATPQEFPLWQGIAGWLLRMGGMWWGMANIASLLFYFLGIYAIYQLSKTMLNSAEARWVTIAWIAQPLVFIYSGMASPDGASIVLCVTFAWATVRYMKTEKIGWAITAAVTGTLSALLKLPFFMSTGLFLGLFLITYYRKSKKKWMMLIGVGLFSSLFFLLWTRHCGNLLNQAEYPLVDLRITQNPDMRSWYFGDLKYKLSPRVWVRGGWRFLNGLFGSIALMPFILVAIAKKHSRFAVLWIVSSTMTLLIFTKIVMQHYHYFLMFSPAIAILMGLAACSIQDKIKKPIHLILFSLAAPLVVLLSLFQGFFGMNRQLTYDDYHTQVAEVLREHTQPSDKLIIQGGGWGGRVLILGERKGLSTFSAAKTIDELGGIEDAREAGYTKIVLITEESPVLHAVQVINPGQFKRKRNFYTGADDPPLKECETLFRDQRICIKTISGLED